MIVVIHSSDITDDSIWQHVYLILNCKTMKCVKIKFTLIQLV